MAARRFRPLRVADIPNLPEPCARCAFWETSLGDLVYPADHREGSKLKLDWAEAVTARWGYCGVLALNDGEPIGFLTVAPSALVPRLGGFSTAPMSSDAAVLMSAQVIDGFRGKGIGRQLVASAASLLVRRDIRALEAIGTNREGPSCMTPTPFLESVGFAIVRPHPVTPRLRMDLQSTQRWIPDLGAAWNRLTELVGQPTSPEPASYAHRDPS
jgi:GNAT superfamily N-acetyltransferase